MEDFLPFKLNAAVDITNKYQPHNRTTALMAPENQNKVIININGNEYVLESNNTEACNLIDAIDYYFLRTMLAKEKLCYLKYGPSSNLNTTAETIHKQ